MPSEKPSSAAAMPGGRLFVALDSPEPAAVRALALSLDGLVGGLKLGLEFFVANGPEGVRTALAGIDLPLFLDLKFHDIPNTVAGAVRSAVALTPAYLTVHASGGAAMLRAAAAAATEEATRLGVPRPRLLAVTVLTSLAGDDLAQVGQEGSVASQVERLARLAVECGMDGVVCSPAEVGPLRAALGPDVVLMVPGIRPVWAEAGDQKRVMTPTEALAAGATHLVVGRPITASDDPAAAARRLLSEITVP